MRFTNFLYICLAAATLSSITETAETWYNSASAALHGHLQSVDSCFKKLKSTCQDYSKSVMGTVKNKLCKRRCAQPVKCMREYLERIKAYLARGRTVVEEEKKIMAKKAKSKAESTTEEEKEKVL